MKPYTASSAWALHGLILGCFLGVARPGAALESPRHSLATFVAEVTPPIGHPLQGNLGVKPVIKIDDPLFVHGIVLLGAGDPIVLVSIDWCGIGNDAHDRWRTKLAEAAGTTFERVLVCAIHQHDAPMADLAAEQLVARHAPGQSTLDLDWHEQMVQRVAVALAKSLKTAQPFTHLGTGEAKVERIASNRRLLGQDGKVELFRGSAMKDPRAKAAPEGVIDPWLKTLSFWNGNKALASISVYATHPMSFYGEGNVSSDFVGLARRKRQADDPGVLHFYANGCGGDIAAGKYNDGSLEARAELTDRLYTAWKSAWAHTKKRPVTTVAFLSIPFRLDPKESAGFQTKDFEAILAGHQSPLSERVRAAYGLSWRQRCEAGKTLDLPVLDFGVAQLLLLPGEPFVEYQLFAQKQRPDSFVVTLGYGDYGPIYIPYDKAFAEGGYEPGTWSFVGVGVEKQLKDAIAKGLGAEPAQPPDAENGCYEKRANLVGFPANPEFISSPSAGVETETVLQNLRLEPPSYPALRWSGWGRAETANLYQSGAEPTPGYKGLRQCQKLQSGLDSLPSECFGERASRIPLLRRSCD